MAFLAHVHAQVCAAARDFPALRVPSVPREDGKPDWLPWELPETAAPAGKPTRNATGCGLALVSRLQRALVQERRSTGPA